MEIVRLGSVIILACAACGACSSGEPAGALGSSLGGTWEVAQTNDPVTIRRVSISLTDTSIEVSAGDRIFSFQQTGDVATIGYGSSGEVKMVSVPNSGPIVDLGTVPLRIGGEWSASKGGAVCQGSFGADLWVSACTGITRISAFGIDPFMGTVTARRTEAGASIFGQLGGSWMVSDTGGATCAVRFAENMFSATCSNASALDGSISLVVDGDTVSGTTNKGAELTGRRI